MAVTTISFKSWNEAFRVIEEDPDLHLSLIASSEGRHWILVRASDWARIGGGRTLRGLSATYRKYLEEGKED